MTNPPRAKGTAAETSVVRWLRVNGFPGADRQPLRGVRDQGDISVCPGIVAEIKSYTGAPGLGQPSGGTLTAWMGQAADERANAGAAHCLLIVKRTGTRDVSRWWAYLPLSEFAALVGGDVTAAGDESGAPVCLTVASLTAVLRAAGYGSHTATA